MYYPYPKKALGKASWRLSALLLISLLTFQTRIFANNREFSAQDYRAQGYDEQKKGNLDKALAFYSEALSLGLESEVLYNDIGVVYEQQGDWQKARIYYLKAIRYNPDYLPPYTNLAYLYQTLGDIQNAEHYFQERYWRAKDGDPWKEAVREELVKINPRFKKKLLQEKVEDFTEELVRQAREEFSLQIQRSENHYQKGSQYLQEKKYKEALQEFDRALLLTPDNPKMMKAKQQVLFSQKIDMVKEKVYVAVKHLDAGDVQSANDMFQEILTLLPEQPVQNFE